MRRNTRYFVGDFETTVYEGQTQTEVWASGLAELYHENAIILNSIEETFDYLSRMKENVAVYYHNLKFDGSFWLDFLLKRSDYQQAIYLLNTDPFTPKFVEDKNMPPKSFKYSISDRGQWYTITIKTSYAFIEIRDSLKLLPFSLKRIGESFKTKHQKLTMAYRGLRFAGCEITDEEQEYLKNDLYVIKEALEIMFCEGHTSLTIGSCCLKEFKKTYDRIDYQNFFPNIYEVEFNNCRGYTNAGDYIKKSYHGGWCYLVKGKRGVRVTGCTFDVNSLYPSMMHSESGNRYPIGKPYFFQGHPPLAAYEPNKYYFIRIKTRFYLKPGMLPCIQIKGNLLYNGTEWLESSDYVDKKTGRRYTHLTDYNGEVQDTRVEMVLTMTDYDLIREHYTLVDCEEIDGCYFYAAVGLFDEYINKYREIKMNSKGAKREEAKLFLNNLYGKMASSTNSSFKYAYLKDDNTIGFMMIPEYDKKPGYIPIGSAITSYARNFTIRAAQKNFRGPKNRGFVYADTDSIHCDLQPDEVKGITIDDKKFCCWKCESNWDIAYFARQKTYIEHVTHEDMEPVDTPYYNVKCAGMPDKCKKIFVASMTGEIPEGEFSQEELEFMETPRELKDFDVGLKVPGKLRPQRMPGGIALVETPYEMR